MQDNLKTEGFCCSSFTAHMPLLMATSAFRLGRRHWSSPQWCYLHHLHKISFLNTVLLSSHYYYENCYHCRDHYHQPLIYHQRIILLLITIFILTRSPVSSLTCAQQTAHAESRQHSQCSDFSAACQRV